MQPKPKPEKKPKMKKRKKKTPRQLLVRDLDNIIREIVFVRDPFSANLVYSEVLNKNGAVEYAINHRNVPQLGHIISRAKITVRWDLMNCHKQDANDNLLHEFYPEVYISWFIENFGLETWNKLLSDSRRVWKYSIDDLETLYFELAEIQRTQESNPNWKPYFTQAQILSGEWRNQ